MTGLILGTPFMSYSNREPTLASLSGLNRSLRQQVVDLLLSIAILKETLSQPPGGCSRELDARAGEANSTTAFGPQSLRKAKRAVGTRIKRCDRQL